MYLVFAQGACTIISLRFKELSCSSKNDSILRGRARAVRHEAASSRRSFHLSKDEVLLPAPSLLWL